MSRTEFIPKRILVIGDLVIDDSWLVGRFESRTATHVGGEHYRSLHHAGSCTKQLCGAGRVAATLHEARTSDVSKHFANELTLFGVWADGDADYLNNMFVPANLMGSTCHRMVPSPSLAPAPRLVLKNLGDVLQAKSPSFGFKTFTTAAPNEASSFPPFILPTSSDQHNVPYYGTTRVFRLFEKHPEPLVQLGRLDWELSPHSTSEGFPCWVPDRLDHDERLLVVARLHKLFSDCKPYDAVVLKDNGKGVVSLGLLRLLLEDPTLSALIGKCPWFVQTKRWEPKYLRLLQRRVDVRVVLYHSIALAMCEKVATWFTAQGRVTSEGIAFLETTNSRCRIGGSKQKLPRLCVVLPTAFSAIAHSKLGNKSSLLYQPMMQRAEVVGMPGSATAFYSALVYGVLANAAGYSISPRDILEAALGISEIWSHREMIRLRQSDTVSPPSELVLCVRQEQERVGDLIDKLGLVNVEIEESTTIREVTNRPQDVAIDSREALNDKAEAVSYPGSFSEQISVHGEESQASLASNKVTERLSDIVDGSLQPRQIASATKPVSTKTLKLVDEKIPEGRPLNDEEIAKEKDRWKESAKSFGIIGELKEGKAYIELSRSAIELSDYVCIAPSRRKEVARLMRAVQGFDPRRSNRSISGLILAKPGSGKTQLIHTLAHDLDLFRLEYNITNMMRLEDLLLSFDQIVTSQVGSKKQKVLIFVDEINATIGGNEVYEAFLTPIEDGYYINAGTKRLIRPCVWLFVGTQTEEEIDKSTKGSDFQSRLTLGTFNISDVPRKQLGYLYLENIYLGALIARRKFPNLKKLHVDFFRFLGGFGSPIYNGPQESRNTRVSLSISNREIRKVVTRELVVDGTGKGRWRDLKKMLRQFSRHMNQIRMPDSKKVLGGVEWINVYDFGDAVDE